MAKKSMDGAEKEPGRIKQMWEAFHMARKHDGRVVPVMVGAFVLPIVVLVILAFTIFAGNVLAIVTWTIVAVALGLLLAVLVLGRAAARAAYAQIEGQPGAVGAVLRSSLKRGWRGNEMPVAINSKTRDAVYRAVGRGGVVLIAEGPKSRTTRMVEEERRKITRTVPNVAINTLTVGPDDDSTPLARLPRALTRFKSVLTKAEIVAVDHRLASLQNTLPIPKGIDPTRVRPSRRRQ